MVVTAAAVDRGVVVVVLLTATEETETGAAALTNDRGLGYGSFFCRGAVGELIGGVSITLVVWEAAVDSRGREARTPGRRGRSRWGMCGVDDLGRRKH